MLFPFNSLQNSHQGGKAIIFIPYTTKLFHIKTEKNQVFFHYIFASPLVRENPKKCLNDQQFKFCLIKCIIFLPVHVGSV